MDHPTGNEKTKQGVFSEFAHDSPAAHDDEHRHALQVSLIDLPPGYFYSPFFLGTFVLPGPVASDRAALYLR